MTLRAVLATFLDAKNNLYCIIQFVETRGLHRLFGFLLQKLICNPLDGLVKSILFIDLGLETRLFCNWKCWIFLKLFVIHPALINSEVFNM